MKRPRKPAAGRESELTKWKVLWRDSLAESHKDYWRAQFCLPDRTLPQIRAEINLKHGVNLLYDKQLTYFCDWEFEQRTRDLEAERQAADEQRIRQAHPDWTKEQQRDELIKLSYARAQATGDFKLGFAAMKEDRAFEAGAFDQRKFEAAMKSKIEAGFDELEKAFKGNPDALKHFNLAREMVRKTHA